MPALLAITVTLGKDTPGKFFGILRGSQGLSFVVGPALGSALSLIALRAPFLVDGILSLVAFGAAFFLIKGHDRATSDHHLGVFRSLHKTFSNWNIFIYLLLGFAALFAFGILSAFVPTQGELIGLKAWEIGLIITTGAIAFSLSSYFVGTISDKKGRKSIVIFALIVMILSGLGFIYANSLETLMVCYIVFSTSEAVPYLLSFVYASEAFDASYIGTAMGAFDSLMDLSLLIAPLLGIAALGMTNEMTYPFIIATIPALLALILSIGWLQERNST
jgi:predicted MFS family arabinose efflux permease